MYDMHDIHFSFYSFLDREWNENIWNEKCPKISASS